MDKKTEYREKRGRDILKELRVGIKRRRGKGAFLLDAALLLISFVFSRCHISFGAYPLGVVLSATAERRVIIIAIGATLGSLTLGSIGYVYAVLVPLAVCLRVLLGGADKPTFKEPYVTRVACSAITAALGGVYELLTRGLTPASVMFASVGVLLSVGISLALYGVCTSKFGIRELLFAPRPQISGEGLFLDGGRSATFLLSASIFIFFISLSLDRYSFFGITLSLCFATLITLVSAVRFGSVIGMAVGFVSGLASGASSAVSFALAGGVSGFLFGVGVGYAVVGGAIALSLWSSFVGGISALLSHLPEYGATALVILPLIKNLSHAEAEAEIRGGGSPSDMVDALSRTIETEGEGVEGAIQDLASAMRAYSAADYRLDFEEYRNIIIAGTAGFSTPPCEEKVDALAGKLYKGDRPSREYLERLFGGEGGEVYPALIKMIAEAERESYITRGVAGVIEEYEHIGRMLMHRRYKRQRDSERDNELSERLSEELDRCGFDGGVAVALGKRRTCVIAAAEDTDGKTVASPLVKSSLEECIGTSLCDFEYYKKDGTSLVRCYAAPRFEVEYAVATDASVRTGVSGDSAAGFESDGAFFSIISDGMGSGDVARRTSRFVVDYLKGSLIPDTPSARDAVSSVSALLHSGRDECSATVDVFSFDLYTGEARFLKCGAATSYIKRGDSIFAVKCTSAPIGLLRGVDAEEMMAEVKGGDIVVMISDGVADLPDEAAWLIEKLALPTKLPPEEYANDILALAKKNGRGSDDITVAVAYVHERGARAKKR